MNAHIRTVCSGAVLAFAIVAGRGTSLGAGPPVQHRAFAPQISRDAVSVEQHLPAVPGGWPSLLKVGVSDPPGGAARVAGDGFGFRYQYLAGGSNTGTGWASWNPNGEFVTHYVSESAAAGVTPVFSYYMIRQSIPGASQDEPQGVRTNLQNVATMRSYLDDVELFFERAGASGSTVVFHFEPDLWGFVQQSSQDDDDRTFKVAVGSTQQKYANGRPDNAAGLAQTVVAMRDALAPNVVLGYHASWWGTGEDPAYSNPSDHRMRELAARSAAFYESLGTNFDVVFMEFSDRDAAFKQYVYGDGGASWWDSDDFRRHLDFIQDFVQLTGLRAVLWQIPQGNTKMRAMDNTWNHYQDNRVQWLFDNPNFVNLKAYVDAGVIALLFGRGADGATCACDANGDGVTNPAPINGNDRVSLNSDDDGGYFREKLATYFAQGSLLLP